MKPGILIPTYNEAGKIGTLIEQILALKQKYEILVVDDNSPDGTGKIADEYAVKFKNVHVLHREEKNEIGDALRDGFKKALELGFGPIITMDGDLSHDPVYLEKFTQLSDRYGLISASRYINGVRVDGWRFRKLLVSKLANMYAAYIIVKPIWDFTSGFRCYNRKFLESIDLDKLHTEGYLIQIQLIYLAYRQKFGVKEIPFIYKDTEYSSSKIKRTAIYKTAVKIFKYRAPFLEILRHLTYLKKEYHRFVEEYEELLNPPELKNQGKFEIPKKFDVSIGVMAYNEEDNIAKCIDALLSQEINSGKIVEIVVVSSGSTDRTNEIVNGYCEKNKKVKLIVQPRRMGKASAINEYLKIANGHIVVLESADTITIPETIEQLIQPFFDKNVGLTGAHPVPVNEGGGFLPFAVQKLWRWHHLIAMDTPKCGEMIAFRNIVPKIPNYTAVDEATIEAIFDGMQLKKAYASGAVVKNKGPETLSDFIKQRRRIAAGHHHLAASMGYQVSTLSSSKIAKYILADMRWTPKEIIFTVILIGIEVISRWLGNLDFYLRDKNPYIWDISKTTKRMVAEAKGN